MRGAIYAFICERSRSLRPAAIDHAYSFDSLRVTKLGAPLVLSIDCGGKSNTWLITTVYALKSFQRESVNCKSPKRLTPLVERSLKTKRIVKLLGVSERKAIWRQCIHK
ncbi:hypothetical protein TNCV_1823251 [Trichonephila clavipes]|nr:hypothetical protein TNCV_1823251 [Trichonephila clavipes]